MHGYRQTAKASTMTDATTSNDKKIEALQQFKSALQTWHSKTGLRTVTEDVWIDVRNVLRKVRDPKYH
jgi:hypothetical protein